MKELLNRVEAREMILDYVKRIATLFDHVEDKTEDAMLDMYVSNNVIFITAFEPNEKCRTIFKMTYFRDTGEVKCE